MTGQPARPDIHPWRRTVRYVLSRVVVGALARALFRLRLDDRDRLPRGPAIYCFNHLSWLDPFVLMAVLPMRPRLHFFGPKEEDMRLGGRNRLMLRTGSAIPYKPGKNDLLDATRRVGVVIDRGWVVAVAGEGRIHLGERDLLPLSEGAAYFALRSGDRPVQRPAGRVAGGGGGRGDGDGRGAAANRRLTLAYWRARSRPTAQE